MCRSIFLLFGDSLTQQGYETDGWVSSLTNAYIRRVDVINRGYSGYNSRWARPVFTKALEGSDQCPLFLSIWLGANDAAMPDQIASFQHVPVREYQANLQSMVEEAKEAGISKILLVTPPPLDENARIVANQQVEGTGNEALRPERTNAAVKKYAEACKKAGQATGIPVCDIFTAFPDGSDNWKQRLLADGLHFSPAGQQRMLELFLESMASHYPELRASELPMDYPDFMEVDPMSPIRSIIENATV